jgi:hypothetical protein
MPLSTIFQLHRGSQFYWQRKQEYPENHDLPQVTDKLYYIMLHQVHFTRAGFKLTILVVIGTGSLLPFNGHCQLVDYSATFWVCT